MSSVRDEVPAVLQPVSPLGAGKREERPAIITTQAGTAPLQPVSRAAFPPLDDAPMGMTGQGTIPTRPAGALPSQEEHSGSLGTQRGTVAGTTHRLVTDAVGEQRKAADALARTSFVSPAQSPPVAASRAPSEAPIEGVSTAEASLGAVSVGVKPARTSDLAVQLSAGTQAASATTNELENGAGDANASIKVGLGQARMPAPAQSAPHGSVRRSAMVVPPGVSADHLAASSHEAEQALKSDYPPTDLTHGRNGQAPVFTEAARLAAAPPVPIASVSALDLPVARVSRSSAAGGIEDRGSLFRQSSASPAPPPAIVRSLPGYDSGTAHVSRAADDATSSPASSPRPGQQGEQASPPDLKALARDLYPLIRRMLIIEKERLPNL